MAVDLSVVIPVHNEDASLPELYRRLRGVMHRLWRPYEIIFVDDGSSDGSLRLMRLFSRSDPHTRYLSLTRNFGQAAALAAGLAASRGRGVITIDADLQNPPEEIPKLVAKFDEGYEVVYGVRKNRQDPLIRRFCSEAISRLLKASMHVDLKPEVTAFCVTHRRVVEELKRCPERTRFHPVLCAWLGARTAHVDVRHERRRRGRSKYGYRPLLIRVMDLITGYTHLPLRLVSWMGFGFAAIGFALAGWAAFRKLTDGTTLLGWASIMGAMGLLGGAQLLAIGALGEYLSRAYEQLLGRPLYVIRETDAAGNRPDLIRAVEVRKDAVLADTSGRPDDGARQGAKATEVEPA